MDDLLHLSDGGLERQPGGERAALQRSMHVVARARLGMYYASMFLTAVFNVDS